MVMRLKQNKIQQAFSRSAERYDELAVLQETIGRQLIAGIAKPAAFERILDIGMGPGGLTQQLKGRWPRACVAGMDLAFGMATRAHRRYNTLKIVQADAVRLPFRRGCFDLVFSNLAYQWVDDLTLAFGEVREVLKPGGSFYASVFSRNSLNELFVSLKRALAGGRHGQPLTIRRLPRDETVVEAARRGGLAVSSHQTRLVRVYFKGMMALLRWLKGIGANRVDRGFYAGKEVLARAGAYYRKCFGEAEGIYVSFEVITIAATKLKKG